MMEQAGICSFGHLNCGWSVIISDTGIVDAGCLLESRIQLKGTEKVPFVLNSPGSGISTILYLNFLSCRLFPLYFVYMIN